MWALSSRLYLTFFSLDLVLAVSCWIVQVLCLAALGILMSIRDGTALLLKCMFAETVFLSSRHVAADAVASDERYVRWFETDFIVAAVDCSQFPVRASVFIALVFLSVAHLGSAAVPNEGQR